MREPKNQMLGTMEPPPLMQLSVNHQATWAYMDKMILSRQHTSSIPSHVTRKTQVVKAIHCKNCV